FLLLRCKRLCPPTFRGFCHHCGSARGSDWTCIGGLPRGVHACRDHLLGGSSAIQAPEGLVYSENPWWRLSRIAGFDGPPGGRQSRHIVMVRVRPMVCVYCQKASGGAPSPCAAQLFSTDSSNSGQTVEAGVETV